MLRRGLHQPVARSRSHKKLGFERPDPLLEPSRGSAKRKEADGYRRVYVARPSRDHPVGLFLNNITSIRVRASWKRAYRPRSAEARTRLTERLPPLPRLRATHEAERHPRFTARRRGPGGPVEAGPCEQGPSASFGHARLDDSRVIHADDEERGAARPPERVPRVRRDDDAGGRNGGLRGCYSVPPRATVEDVPASPGASSSSSSSWRRRDPTRWRRASSGRMLRVLVEGQVLTKRGQRRR